MVGVLNWEKFYIALGIYSIKVIKIGSTKLADLILTIMWT